MNSEIQSGLPNPAVSKIEMTRLREMHLLGLSFSYPRKRRLEVPGLGGILRSPTPKEIERYCRLGARVLAAVYGSESEPVRRFRQQSARAFHVVAVETPRGYEGETPKIIEIADIDSLRKTLEILAEAYRHAKRSTNNSTKQSAPLTAALKPSVVPAAFAGPRGEYIWRCMEAMRPKPLRNQLELARKADVDPASISRFVRRKNTPPGRRQSGARRKILGALGIKNEAQIPE
jgi:hypothetical protein